MFRFFLSSVMPQAAKNIAKSSFIVGLFLIGFGMLVFILRDLFALLAAGLFFLSGFSAMVYAVKIYLSARKMARSTPDSRDAYRKNVRIHHAETHEEHFDE